MIIYQVTDEEGLSLIQPLWEQLLAHHQQLPSPFAVNFAQETFARHSEELLARAAHGKLRIDLAKNTETGAFIGYSLAIISSENVGEIDSIFVEEAYRRGGIGDALMRSALAWMDAEGVTSKRVDIYAANVNILTFYHRHGFLPHTLVLLQIPSGQK